MVVRVDDRFIHGQVIHKWIDYLQVRRIVIADDLLINNQLYCNILRVAKPDEIPLVITSCAGAAKAVREAGDPLLLTGSLQNAVTLIGQIPQIDRVIIGRLPAAPGKKRLYENFYSDRQDLDAMRLILSKNIRVVLQTVPDQEPVDIARVLEGLR